MRTATLILGLLVVVPSFGLVAEALAPCGPQPVHTYAGPVGVFGFYSNPPGAGFKTGLVQVFDTNTADCNGDGIPMDRDGDWDAGFGGAFFGWGPWAAPCGVNVHGPDVIVTDAVWANNVAFEVGEDDQTAVGCATDGMISPALDPDDCLSNVYLTPMIGTTCGPGGGDGGYWVILDVDVLNNCPPTGTTNPAAFGTITAGSFGAGPGLCYLDGAIAVQKLN